MEVLSNVLQIVLNYLVPLGVVTLISYIAVKLKPILEDKTAKKCNRNFSKCS